MDFWVTLIRTTEKPTGRALQALKDNCTYVDEDFWIMEGDVDSLRDEGVKCMEMADGVVGSLGDMTKKQLRWECVGLLGYERAAKLGLNDEADAHTEKEK